MGSSERRAISIRLMRPQADGEGSITPTETPETKGNEIESEDNEQPHNGQ